MTINAADSITSNISLMNTNTATALNASVSFVSTSTTELTEEEKKYDLDNDGVLSTTEQTAMLEAQATEKALEASKAKRTSDSEAVSVSISQEGLKMQTQNQAESLRNRNEMDFTAHNNEQRLMNEAISEYQKFSPANGLNTIE